MLHCKVPNCICVEKLTSWSRWSSRIYWLSYFAFIKGFGARCVWFVIYQLWIPIANKEKRRRWTSWFPTSTITKVMCQISRPHHPDNWWHFVASSVWPWIIYLYILLDIWYLLANKIFDTHIQNELFLLLIISFFNAYILALKNLL